MHAIGNHGFLTCQVITFRPGTFSELHVYHSVEELRQELSETGREALAAWPGEEPLILTDIHGKPSCQIRFFRG